MPFPITAAQLSGNFCETLFYGMYLVTCCFCARALLLTGNGRDERWLRLSEIRWLMASVAIAMFAILTFDTAVGLLHNFHAFVQAQNATTEFLNIGDWINIVRTVDQGLVTFLGDFILIYRCWIVYGRRWLIIVPSVILYLATISVELRLIITEADPSIQKNISLSSKQTRPWNVAFFAITAFQNVVTTSILIWRIWRVERQGERYLEQSGSLGYYQPRRLGRVIRIIAESGAAYTMMAFITFVVSASGSDALYPTSDMTLVTTGIAFNVILVRSSTRRDQQFKAFDTTITEGGRNGSTTLNSINLEVGKTKNTSGREDIELTVKGFSTSGRDFQPQPEIYPSGISVTKSVVTA